LPPCPSSSFSSSPRRQPRSRRASAPSPAVFKYYGNGIEDGIDPIAFIDVTAAACHFAVLGAWIFERRDLAA
jgi:hypothetical protein